MKKIFQLTLVATLSVASWGGLVVIAESDPTAVTSSVADVVTYDFNDRAVGSQAPFTYDFGGITGTYTNVNISGSNNYGGVGMSVYPTAHGTTSYTLSLSEDVNYFGMWWAAGDPGNLLQFYLNDSLVASYSTAAAFAALPDEFKGNFHYIPEVNTSEFYAYLNFHGTDGTVFNKIVFSNSGNSGFESDNHAILKAADPGDGIDVSETPEPSTFALIGSAAIALGILRRRRA